MDCVICNGKGRLPNDNNDKLWHPCVVCGGNGKVESLEQCNAMLAILTEKKTKQRERHEQIQKTLRYYMRETCDFYHEDMKLIHKLLIEMIATDNDWNTGQ